VGFGRIHTLAGEYSEGEFWMGPKFEQAERGFWESLLAGMDDVVRKQLERNADVVQRAVLVGSVMNAFFLEGGNVIPARVSVKALPKFLTYRIPLVRGKDEPPYSG
jgi:hypothetical protein